MADTDPRLIACARAFLPALPEFLRWSFYNQPPADQEKYMTDLARAVILEWLKQEATEGMAWAPNHVELPSYTDIYSSMCATAAKEIGGE